MKEPKSLISDIIDLAIKTVSLIALVAGLFAAKPAYDSWHKHHPRHEEMKHEKDR